MFEMHEQMNKFANLLAAWGSVIPGPRKDSIIICCSYFHCFTISWKKIFNDRGHPGWCKLCKKSKKKYKFINKRMLRKIIDIENEEIEKQKKKEQQRLINEASLKYNTSESSSQIRSIPQMMGDIYKAVLKFTEKLLLKDEKLRNEVEKEEKEIIQKNNEGGIPPLGGCFYSIFTPLYRDTFTNLSKDLSSVSSLSSSSFTRFKLEQMFIVLIAPEENLKKFFEQLDQNTLKKEFKKLALLLHPDKNPSSYAKVAFNKMFSIYQKCLNSEC